MLQEEAARKAAEQAAHEIERQRQQLHVTLSSIGDGVIVTDADGNVTFINPIAERLTGWQLADATGQPLEHVFKIINEDSRGPVENPVNRAPSENCVIELANHTALVTKDGRVLPIEDSARADSRRGRGRLRGGARLPRRDGVEAGDGGP